MEPTGEYEAVHVVVVMRVQSRGEKFVGRYYEDNIDPLLSKIEKVLTALSNDSYTVIVPVSNDNPYGIVDALWVDPQ